MRLTPFRSIQTTATNSCSSNPTLTKRASPHRADGYTTTGRPSNRWRASLKSMSRSLSVHRRFASDHSNSMNECIHIYEHEQPRFSAGAEGGHPGRRHRGGSHVNADASASLRWARAPATAPSVPTQGGLAPRTSCRCRSRRSRPPSKWRSPCRGNSPRRCNGCPA